jgi:hypothetical protein
MMPSLSRLNLGAYAISIYVGSGGSLLTDTGEKLRCYRLKRLTPNGRLELAKGCSLLSDSNSPSQGPNPPTPARHSAF